MAESDIDIDLNKPTLEERTDEMVEELSKFIRGQRGCKGEAWNFSQCKVNGEIKFICYDNLRWKQDDDLSMLIDNANEVVDYVMNKRSKRKRGPPKEWWKVMPINK